MDVFRNVPEFNSPVNVNCQTGNQLSGSLTERTRMAPKSLTLVLAHCWLSIRKSTLPVRSHSVGLRRPTRTAEPGQRSCVKLCNSSVHIQQVHSSNISAVKSQFHCTKMLQSTVGVHVQTKTVRRQFTLQFIQRVGVIFRLFLFIACHVVVRQIFTIDNCSSSNSNLHDALQPTPVLLTKLKP